MRLLIGFLLGLSAVFLSVFSFASSTPGGWTVVPSPDGDNYVWSFSGDVSCLSETSCWAVGSHRTSDGIYHTLTEHWDGAAWSIVPSPNTSAQDQNFLWGVSCLSGTECWAVGQCYIGSTRQALIEKWDGTAWTIASSTSNGSPEAGLYDLACNATSDCWAVGYYVSGSGNRTLVEHWDGNAWTIVSSPNGSSSSAFGGIACTGGSDCWAVGGNGGTSTGVLIEHWNGTAWSVASLPNPSIASLSGVACTSVSQCWAVGESYTTLNSPGQPIIAEWDGTTWSLVNPRSSPHKVTV
jgi:hypothetical protein